MIPLAFQAVVSCYSGVRKIGVKGFEGIVEPGVLASRTQCARIGLNAHRRGVNQTSTIAKYSDQRRAHAPILWAYQQINPGSSVISRITMPPDGIS
jgi:hypothetical protein